MKATRLNHVSVSANDLEESARFYEELFGLERIPTAKFGSPVLWLSCGENQLHLFLRDKDAPRFHHLAFDVDDFEGVYLKAKEMGALDFETHGAAIRAHPSGWVQMYIRDPAGNLLEVDTPDSSALDRSVITDLRELEEQVPQTGDAAVATLYHTAGVPG